MKEIKSIEDLTPDEANANKHSQRGMGMVERSIREYGYGDSVTVDQNGKIISGNGRAEVLVDIALTNAIVIQTDGTRPIIHQRTDLNLDTDERARMLSIALNRSQEVNLSWDTSVLQELVDAGADLSSMWFEDELARLLEQVALPDNTGENTESTESMDVTTAKVTLAERFGVPPFSVLDARQGYWQKRKQAWIALGIKSELGRGVGLTMSAEQVTAEQVTAEQLNFYRNKNKANAELGGSKMPATDYSKQQRGTGTGKAIDA